MIELKITVDGVEKLENSIQLSEKLKGSVKEVNDSVKQISQSTKVTANDFNSLGSVGKKALTSLGGGFKGLTTTIKAMGAAVKANPLLLLVSILAPIIVKLGEFISNLEIVQVYLDLIGKVLGVVTDAINWFTDAIGLTSKAADDLVEKQITQQENLAKIVQNNYAIAAADINTQIKLLKSQGASIDEIQAKERELARVQYLAAKANVDAKIQEIELKRKSKGVTDEQIEALNEELRLLKQVQREAYANIIITQNAQEKANKEAEESEKKRIADNAKKQSDAAAQARSKREQEAKTEAARQQKLREEFAALDLKAKRDLEDQKALMIQDSFDRESEKLRLQQERFEESTKDSLDKYKSIVLERTDLTLEQKKELIQRKEDEIASIILNNAQLVAEKQDEIENNRKQKEIAEARKLELLKLQIKEEGIDATNFLSDEGYLKTKEAVDRALALTIESIDKEREIIKDKYDYEAGLLRDSLEAREISYKEYVGQIELLDAKKTKSLKDNTQKVVDAEEQAATVKEELHSMQMAAIKETADAVFNGLLDNLEEGSVAYKATAIAQTTMKTIESARGAYNSVVGVPFVGPVLAPIAAAAATASGVAAVRKIMAVDVSRNAKGNSGNLSLPGNSGNLSLPITAATNNVNTTPAFNLYGKSNNMSEGDSSQFNSVQQDNEPLRAYVSWNDIDSVTNKNNKINRQSKL